MTSYVDAGVMPAAKPVTKTWADEVDEADDGGFILPHEPAADQADSQNLGGPYEQSVGPMAYGDSNGPRSAAGVPRRPGSFGAPSTSQHIQTPAAADPRQFQTGHWPATGTHSIIVSNLPLEAEQHEIAAAFRRALNVQVHQIRHRPTPAEPWVIVDLAEQQDLQVVLQAPLGSVTLAGRPLVLEVVPSLGYGMRSTGPYGGACPPPPEHWHSRANMNSGNSSSITQPPAPPVPPHAAVTPGIASAAQSGQSSRKADPFGGAKPVDTAAVYLDGHPHHAAAAEARMGVLAVGVHQQRSAMQDMPDTSDADTQLHMQRQGCQDQRQVPHGLERPVGKPLPQPQMGVKLLQRPQALLQQEQVQLEQQEVLQSSGAAPAPFDRPVPAGLDVQPRMQNQPVPLSRGPQQGPVPMVGPGPAFAHPGYFPAHSYPPPPPPPPPPRPVSGSSFQEQQTLAEEPAGVVGPGLQGQWAARGGARLGYRALASSSRTSGTGSAGSSRRGSTLALVDDTLPSYQGAPADLHSLTQQAAAQNTLQQQQQHCYDQQRVIVGEGNIQQYVGMPAYAPQPQQPQQPGRLAVPAEDDWGRVEELLNQESKQQPVEQVAHNHQTENQQQQQQQQQQRSLSPDEDQQQQQFVGTKPGDLVGTDGWGTATSSSPAGQNLDSWGAEPSSSVSAANPDSWGAEPIAEEAGAPPACSTSTAGLPQTSSKPLQEVSSSGAPSSSSSYGRGRGTGRGRGPSRGNRGADTYYGQGPCPPQALQGTGGPQSSVARQQYGRGRGRGRGWRGTSGDGSGSEHQQYVPRQDSSPANGIAAAEAADASAAASAAVADMQAPISRASSQDVLSRSGSYSRSRGRAGGRAGRGILSRLSTEGVDAAGVHVAQEGGAAEQYSTPASESSGNGDVLAANEHSGRRRGLGSRRGAHATARAASGVASTRSWVAVDSAATEAAAAQQSQRGRGRSRGGRGAPADSSLHAEGYVPAAGDVRGGRGRGGGRNQPTLLSAAQGSTAEGGTAGKQQHQRKEQKGGSVAAVADPMSRKASTGATAAPAVAAAAAAGSKKPAAAPTAPAKSKGEKLFHELSAKDKDKKQGAKLDNPFALLAQLAAD